MTIGIEPGVWFLRKLRQTGVEFKDTCLVYRDGRQANELPYYALQSVTTSPGYIICFLEPNGTRFTIPLQFSGNAMILARLRNICKKKANSERSTSRQSQHRDCAPERLICNVDHGHALYARSPSFFLRD